MEELKVKLKDGEVVIRKPTAGIRNKALISAETDSGFKKSLMMVELLPMCVAAHPWGIKPIKGALDMLSIVEYDQLIDVLEKLIGPDEELKKKLKESSDQLEKENIGSLESTETKQT